MAASYNTRLFKTHPADFIYPGAESFVCDSDHSLSRRRFLQTLGFGAVAVATVGYSVPAIAKSDLVLPFRIGADTLPLHYNENSMGMSPKAFAAAKEGLKKYANRYAVEQVLTLQSDLASHHDVEKEQVILGNGSTEVLSAVATFAANIDAVVVEPSPTFGALRRYAKSRGMNVITVPVSDSFTIDIQAIKKVTMQQKSAVLINLCNPNNPTGNIVKRNVLSDWIANAPENHYFLMDEAYFDFAASDPDYQSMLSMVQKGYDNVIVARTFSKIYGMAGLRIGYGVATAKTAAKIKPFAAGFNLNVAGLQAASASLADTQYYAKSVASTAESKTILIDALNELSLDYVPSHTNFVLHQLKQPLSGYAEKMLANNIKVGRKMTQSEYWNRLSLGTPEQMRHFVKALKVFRQKGWA